MMGMREKRLGSGTSWASRMEIQQALVVAEDVGSREMAERVCTLFVKRSVQCRSWLAVPQNLK